MANQPERAEIPIQKDLDISQRSWLVAKLEHERGIIDAWFEGGGSSSPDRSLRTRTFQSCYVVGYHKGARFPRRDCPHLSMGNCYGILSCLWRWEAI